MIHSLAMHPTNRRRNRLQDRLDADALAESALQRSPKIMGAFQLPGHQPATVKRSGDFSDTSGIDLHRRETSAAQLFGNSQLTKWPGWPGEKPLAGNRAQNPAMTIAPEQCSGAVGQLHRAHIAAPIKARRRAVTLDIQASRKLDFPLAIGPDRQAIALRVGQLLKTFRYRAPDHIVGKHTGGNSLAWSIHATWKVPQSVDRGGTL